MSELSLPADNFPVSYGLDLVRNIPVATCNRSLSYNPSVQSSLVQFPLLKSSNFLISQKRFKGRKHCGFMEHMNGRFQFREQNYKSPISQPQVKGIVIKTVIKRPVKPNSGKRKCVLVRVKGGKEVLAYIPGEGHNLQEHNVVLIKHKGPKDTPHVNFKCIRGKYDLGFVNKKKLR